MSTLYFPFLLLPLIPPKNPPPILLLKMSAEQAILALSDIKTFREAFETCSGAEQAVRLLLRLGVCERSPYHTFLPCISPEVAEKFTVFVNRWPQDIVTQFEIDISTQPFTTAKRKA
ncbi:MAG: hypothetical protein Q7R64_02435 [bacterium]|nr:hypothetical protein [bacterium]